ncbi:MAG TPA: DNA/pantothenate metabolism flavoprotein domain protein [Verrucomicrobiales bacterium]|jgi:phosphopantothenoylcysteine decarboxylase/phosphopantothenate--cysteine ligase|nr:DNA/pantothenate metabolism flavoprotein domain protein [Verrucomicrobiales bacterium]
MHCLITAGPTVELIDAVRRLTNHSTGRLGCGLADALARAGHRVTLLLSETAVHAPKAKKVRVLRFNTTKDLHEQLEAAAALRVKAVFHVAAVSDFTVKRPRKGKIPTTASLTLELKPTVKLIRSLRKWFPDAFLVGWKYEVEGGKKSTVAAARAQINKCKTDACVANGPAYGEGFGVVADEVAHCEDDAALFRWAGGIFKSQ